MLRLWLAFATSARSTRSDARRTPSFATGAGSLGATPPWTNGTECARGTTTWQPFGGGGQLARTPPIQIIRRRRRQEGHSRHNRTNPAPRPRQNQRLPTLLHRGRCLLKQRLGTAPAPPHRHHPPRHHRLRYSPHPLPRRPLQRPLRRPLPRPLQCPPRQHRLRFGPHPLLRHPLRCVPLRHPLQHRLRRPLRPRRASHSLTCSRRC